MAKFNKKELNTILDEFSDQSSDLDKRVVFNFLKRQLDEGKIDTFSVRKWLESKLLKENIAHNLKYYHDYGIPLDDEK